MQGEAGWGWVSAPLQAHAAFDGCAAERLQPTPVRLSKGERAAVETLRAELDALDDQLEAAADDDPLWRTREETQDALDRLLAKGKRWDPKLIKHAGVAITVAHDGTLAIAEGLIRRSDLKALNAARKRPAADESAPLEDDVQNARRLPQALVRDLTLARTRAIRATIAVNPHVALALFVHVLAQQTLAHRPCAGVGLSARVFGYEDDDALTTARDACAQRAQMGVEAHWRACLAASTEELLADLAICMAGLIDVSHAGASVEDRRKQAAGDAIAAALNLDMSTHWRPDESFWLRAPRTLALAALSGAPEFAALSETARTEALAQHAKCKKADLSAIAGTALAESGWLPDVLITPLAPGALELTPEGQQALADTAAA